MAGRGSRARVSARRDPPPAGGVGELRDVRDAVLPPGLGYRIGARPGIHRGELALPEGKNERGRLSGRVCGGLVRTWSSVPLPEVFDPGALGGREPVRLCPGRAAGLFGRGKRGAGQAGHGQGRGRKNGPRRLGAALRDGRIHQHTPPDRIPGVPRPDRTAGAPGEGTGRPARPARSHGAGDRHGPGLRGQRPRRDGTARLGVVAAEAAGGPEAGGGPPAGPDRARPARRHRQQPRRHRPAERNGQPER